jgi:amino acid transporter
MARHGVFPQQVGNSHDRNRTPHVAITVFTIAAFAIPTAMQHYTNPLTTFGDAGTLAAFGFLLAYFMISIAAPVYLRKLGQLTRRDIAVCVAAIVCLLVPTVGSFYPVPAAPVSYFPYYFLAYMLAGTAWLTVLSRRKAGVLDAIKVDLENTVDAHGHGPAATPAFGPAVSPAGTATI